MARGKNLVILIGNLGRDPELKTFANGGSVCNATLATSETWKGRDGSQQEHTEWHNLVFNDKLGEVVHQYLRKGSKIYVEGSIRTRKYQDKDGREARFSEIRVREMQMLDGKRDNDHDEPSREREQTRRPAQQPTGHQGGGGFVDDDIPFAQRHWNEG